jgi:predicted nucleotidyltransferase
MNEQSNIISIIKSLKPELKERFFVNNIGLFGSVVRNDFTMESDVDVIVDFIKPVGIEFIELAEYTNAFKQRMVMKREVIANKGLWTTKKRYMLNVLDEEGITYDEPKIKIMGIEAVRSSTPEVCRGKIKDAIKIIMNKDEDTLISFVSKFKGEFSTYEAEIGRAHV